MPVTLQITVTLRLIVDASHIEHNKILSLYSKLFKESVSLILAQRVSHTTGVTPRSEKNVYMFMAEDYSGSKLCQTGDIVINTMWAWMGALGVSEHTGLVSPSYGVYRSIQLKRFNAKFLEWLLRSQFYVEHYNKVSTGLHTSRLRFYAHMFFDMFLGFPSREEQDSIVENIDAESTKIDVAIDLKERQIEALKEYKVTLINATVTGKIKVN